MDPSSDRTALFRAVHRGQNHTLRNVALAGAAVLLLLACLGGVAYHWATGEYERAILRAAGDTTDRFVRDLEAGDHPAAYGLLCAGTQADLTMEHFDADLRGQPHVRTHRLVSSYLMKAAGHPGAVIIDELTLDTGAIDAHTFRIVTESGAWRVCNRSWPY